MRMNFYSFIMIARVFWAIARFVCDDHVRYHSYISNSEMINLMMQMEKLNDQWVLMSETEEFTNILWSTLIMDQKVAEQDIPPSLSQSPISI